MFGPGAVCLFVPPALWTLLTTYLLPVNPTHCNGEESAAVPLSDRGLLGGNPPTGEELMISRYLPECPELLSGAARGEQAAAASWQVSRQGFTIYHWQKVKVVWHRGRETLRAKLTTLFFNSGMKCDCLSFDVQKKQEKKRR